MNKDLITVSVKNGDYSVIVEVPKEAFNTKTGMITDALKKCLNSITEEEIEYLQPIGEQHLQQHKKAIERDNNEFKIRERIPNNIVDVKSLDVKQAITEKALVRCPHCGQAHALVVHSGSNIYFMERNFDKDEFNIIFQFDSSNEKQLTGMCCKEDMDKLAYFYDLQSLKAISDDDFVLDNTTELFCPVCHTSNTFEDWKNAYEHPLNYFETEHLCDVCGGETVTKVVKENKINKCEKCGYETDYKEE